MCIYDYICTTDTATNSALLARFLVAFFLGRRTMHFPRLPRFGIRTENPKATYTGSPGGFCILQTVSTDLAVAEGVTQTSRAGLMSISGPAL